MMEISDSDYIAIIGLIINALFAILNVVVGLIIARKSMRAMLETAPSARLRARAVRKSRRHPLRRAIIFSRVEQLVSALLPLGVIPIVIAINLLSSGLPVLYWAITTDFVLMVILYAYIFILAQQTIRDIRKNLRPFARMLRHGRSFDLLGRIHL